MARGEGTELVVAVVEATGLEESTVGGECTGGTPSVGYEG